MKNVNSIMLSGVLKVLTKRQEVVFIFSLLPQLSGMPHYHLNVTVTGKPFTAQAPVKEDHHYLELPDHPSPLESNFNSALQHLFCPLSYQCPISFKRFPVPSETQGQVSEKSPLSSITSMKIPFTFLPSLIM